MLKRRVGEALGLGIATSILVGLAGSYLPYSHARDTIIDALATPGALIAGLVYPQGVHTSGGARYLVHLVLLFNLIAYSLFWYGCLRIVGYFTLIMNDHLQKNLKEQKGADEKIGHAKKQD